MSKPNIIYLHSHDTGRYVQPYGHAIDTPNLQRLAEEGVLFRQAFCAAPTCSPSRACLLTGQWAHCNGMIGLVHRGSRLLDHQHLLWNALKPHGYATALAGFQHVGPKHERDKLGFDQIVAPKKGQGVSPGDHDRNVADAAADFIAGREDDDQPFFLDVGFTTPHRTNKRGEDVQWFNHNDSPVGDPRYCMPPAPLPDTPRTRQDMADFKVAANRLDGYMGRVIDAVDQAGLRDDTLIIATTDHGIAFPDMKCNLTDHGMGVMMIMRGPGGFGTGRDAAASEGAGKVIDAMVSQIDVFPTVCEVAGIDQPDWLQGESMLPVIRGEAEQLHEHIFAEVSYHAAYEPKRGVRTQRYKYIRRWNDPRKQQPGPVLPNCDDSVSKTQWVEQGWSDRTPDPEQLYDLVFDPHETNNLVVGDRAPEVLSDMRQRLDQWMRDTDDPLLEQGRVPPRPEMHVTDPDRYSPGDKPLLVETA